MNTLKDVSELANKLINTTYTFEVSGKTYVMNCGEQGDYTFKFDNAKRRLGCCKYSRKEITLSRPLCLENLDKLHTQLKDAILHEIAHALCLRVYGVRRGRGHGKNWVSIAKQIGCNGERCYSSSDIKRAKSKYILKCNTCNYERPKHRLKMGISYSCGKCSPNTYNPKFVLEIIKNF